MSEEPDDGLRWVGDEGDAPVRPGPARPTPARKPAADAAAADTDAADALAADTDTDTDAAAPGDGHSASGSVLLVVYGIIAGIYLLFTIGWLIGVVRDPYSQADLFAEIMYQLGEFLAIGAPAVWFLAAVVLTRGRPVWARLLWLALGAVLLVPWPFLLGAS